LKIVGFYTSSLKIKDEKETAPFKMKGSYGIRSYIRREDG
jgi:hypothetical protein